MSESIQMTKIVVTYINDSEIPLIKDIGIAAMKDLLRNAKKVLEQVQMLKTSFQGMADNLKKLEIPLEEVTKDIKDLKVSLKEVTQDIKVESSMNVEKVAEDLKVMKIKGFKIETLMDTENEDTVEVLMWEDLEAREYDLKH